MASPAFAFAASTSCLPAADCEAAGAPVGFAPTLNNFSPASLMKSRSAMSDPFGRSVARSCYVAANDDGSSAAAQEIDKQQNRDRDAKQPRQHVAPAAFLMSSQRGDATDELREWAVHGILLLDLRDECSLKFNGKRVVADQLFGPILSGTVSAHPQLL